MKEQEITNGDEDTTSPCYEETVKPASPTPACAQGQQVPSAAQGTALPPTKVPPQLRMQNHKVKQQRHPNKGLHCGGHSKTNKQKQKITH